MLNVFKDKEYQLVIDTEFDFLIITIEKRYGIDEYEPIEITIYNDKDILKLYNQIGELLGIPEQKVH